MSASLAVRREMVAVCRRLWERGLIAGPDGNVSVRIAPDRILVTPAGMSKVDVGPEDLVELAPDGRQLRGSHRASSEVSMHLRIYARRPDVRAVVHAHPPTATGFAVAGIALDRAVLAEVITTLGSIPIAEYATPSTEELPAAVRKYVKAHDGLLLANHGALALAGDVMSAYYRMETIEHFAKISLVARTLGREQLLSREEVERLQGLRGMYGIASPAPICTDDSMPMTGGQLDCQVVQAPDSEQRIVPQDLRMLSKLSAPPAAQDGEIRLTYRELTALIEDALRALK
jgi:L-fuculose-phosphate aldolase